jgi:pyridoxal phosphate enzyme (YggS family)
MCRVTNGLLERFESVHERIARACEKADRNRNEVRLITVTKTWPAEVLQSVLDTGNPDIGENRVQEIVEKVPALSGNKSIHMIGHLQSNKVTKVVPLVDWIHSIDSEKLLLKVDQQCEKIDKTLNVLIQVNASGELTKSGCTPEDAYSLCEKAFECSHVNFRGFMTIGPFVSDEKVIRESFVALRKTGEECQGLSDKPLELSMGMSSDYEIAIEEGSTMVRIGSLILGDRVY